WAAAKRARSYPACNGKIGTSPTRRVRHLTACGRSAMRFEGAWTGSSPRGGGGNEVRVGLLDALDPVGGPTELDRVQHRCHSLTPLRYEVDPRLALWRKPDEDQVLVAHRRPRQRHLRQHDGQMGEGRS